VPLVGTQTHSDETVISTERAGTRPAPTNIFLEYLSMKNNWQTKKLGESLFLTPGVK